MRYTILLLLSICTLSCKKDTFVHPDYIIFGAIQGSCADGCRFVYYLDGQKLVQDETAKYFATRDLSLFQHPLSDDKFNAAKALIDKVPVALTQTNKTLFIDLNASSPDLWYAEIQLHGRTYAWTFDNSVSGTPAYLKPFAEELIRISLSLQ